MAQQVQELIDKIKSEGIQVADQKSQEIQGQANEKAQKIIEEAKVQADQLLVQAKEEVKKMQESTHMALKQASRDTLLALRKKIEDLLNQILKADISASLTPDSLASIIESVIKNSQDAKNKDAAIEVTLNSKDCEKLKKGFFAKLQKEVKGTITLMGSDDIGQGFNISYDGGKSSYDFTDESLANYLGTYLNSQVASLVSESITEKAAV